MKAALKMKKNTSSAILGIEAVAQRSGLSQHLIRVWERRYAAVKPLRTGSNRRLYSEEDAHRLDLLGRAVKAGHRISDVARIPTAKLEELIAKERPGNQISARALDSNESDYIVTALEAVERLDAEALSTVLARADVDFGQARALETIIMPLMERIGDMWEGGNLRIANEHMATAVVVHHVGSILENFRYEPDAPVILTATPVGQLHEAGALAVAILAAVAGWRPLYLGPNLPAEEIAAGALKSDARAVALSLVYPADDSKLPAEIKRLRRLLPHDLTLLIGGRAAESYKKAIDYNDAVFISDLASLKQRLEQIRASLGHRRQ